MLVVRGRGNKGSSGRENGGCSLLHGGRLGLSDSRGGVGKEAGTERLVAVGLDDSHGSKRGIVTEISGGDDTIVGVCIGDAAHDLARAVAWNVADTGTVACTSRLTRGQVRVGE